MQKAKVFNLPPGPFNQRLISPSGGEVKKTFLPAKQQVGFECGTFGPQSKAYKFT